MKKPNNSIIQFKKFILNPNTQKSIKGGTENVQTNSATATEYIIL